MRYGNPSQSHFIRYRNKFGYCYQTFLSLLSYFHYHYHNHYYYRCYCPYQTFFFLLFIYMHMFWWLLIIYEYLVVVVVVVTNNINIMSIMKWNVAKTSLNLNTYACSSYGISPYARYVFLCHFSDFIPDNYKGIPKYNLTKKCIQDDNKLSTCKISFGSSNHVL